MKRYEKIYKELRKEYTDEEIADSMLIPEDLSEKEQRTANEKMKAFRLKLLKERTESQRIYSDLLRFKYLMEDDIRQGNYSSDHSFGAYLEEYIRILNRTKKSISQELDVHYTTLSRIINDREDPNIELLYRLEKHSGEIVPALYWWKLVQKKQEDEIKKDRAARNREGSRVTNAIEHR